ncbi:MAG: hypothetical protein IPP79_21770 [Chitinophagaceae bacterium]|nr:hypothetical protein [Chitinophagaceae bacterium]
MSPFVLIPILYILFTWIYYKWSKSHSLDLSWQQVALAFGLKVLLGVAYGYIFYTYYKGDDTWYFNSLAEGEYQKLVTDTGQFFSDFNPIPAFSRNPTIGEGWYFYLSELELALLTKPLALFHFITGGDYYNNVVLYNFISFWPMLWLYGTYKEVFPNKKTALYITIFLVPSLLFWLSGIRGDGYLMLFLVLLLVNFHQWVSGRKGKQLLYILIGIAGIIVFRSVLLFLLLPVLTCWFITVRFRKKILPVVAIVYGITAILFFGSIFVSAEKNLPGIVSERQAAFLRLKGNTRYELDSLRPTVGSYLKVLPQAINNSFFRPYAWEWKGSLQGVAAIDILLLFILAFLCFWKNEGSAALHFSRPLLFYPIIFAITLYIFIGYTIPFPGAIIRYKIPGEWFLVIAFITGISWQKLIKLKK